MRNPLVWYARISLNPGYATAFVLTSLTMVLTGYGLYGSYEHLNGSYFHLGTLLYWIISLFAATFGFILQAIDPIWYLSNMQPIMWGGIAIAALNIIVLYSAPYLLRKKQLKLKGHFDRKHVIRSLFPTVVFVTYPMLLAKGMAGSGAEGAAAFIDSAEANYNLADRILTYGFIASGIQLVHGGVYAFLKRSYDRHVAVNQADTLKADLEASGICVDDASEHLKGKSAKEIQKIRAAAQAAAASRQKSETMLREAAEEDQANQANLRKLLKLPAVPQTSAPTGPVLIVDEDEEAEAASPADAPQQA